MMSILEMLILLIGGAYLWFQIFVCKKTDEKLNAVIWLIVSFWILLLYGATTAGIIGLIKIPITAGVMGTVYLITAIIIQMKLARVGRQAFFWDWVDAFIVIALGIGILIFVLNYFSPHLSNCYSNSDAAVHFKNAMFVFRNHTLENMYFAPLHTSLILHLFEPFVAEVSLYKAFILIDGFMLFLELAFFYVLIREYMKSFGLRIVGIGILLFYFAGYPLNSFIFSFFYWSMGVTLIGFLIFMIRCFAEKTFNRSFCTVCLMMGCACLTVCYMLFSPCAYIATLFSLIAIKAKEGKIFCKENVFLALKVFLLPCVIGLYYALYDFLVKNDLSVTAVMGTNGGIYGELYINFLWTAPFVVYALIMAFKKKVLPVNMIFLLIYGFFTIAMLFLSLKGMLTPYYYYKSYFPIWMFAFVITSEVIGNAWAKYKEVVLAWILIVCGIVCSWIGGFENKIIEQGNGLAVVNRSATLLDIYNFNKAWIDARHVKYGAAFYDLCNFVITETDEFVPFYVDVESYAMCFWYEGITGNRCEGYYTWEKSFEELVEQMRQNNIHCMCLIKGSVFYESNREYIEPLQHIYENDLGAVVKLDW